MPKTVLVLVPHPDDAEFACGGTLALMAAAGDRVIIVTATDGSKGTFEHQHEEIARLRAAEAVEAARILGAETPVMLRHPDLELERLPAGDLRREFIHLIRRFCPDVVICQDPFNPQDLHPDHRATAWAAAEAVNFAQLPLLHPEQLSAEVQPHFVTEKYFYYPKASEANKIVDITAVIESKISALAAHKSQVKFLVDDIFRQGKMAGVDIPAHLGHPPDAHLAALTFAVRAEASEAGQPTGYLYAEAFRYVRYNSFVEDLIQP
jgi:LmbE family N-acetylglucosaminyl deacetylase